MEAPAEAFRGRGTTKIFSDFHRKYVAGACGCSLGVVGIGVEKVMGRGPNSLLIAHSRILQEESNYCLLITPKRLHSVNQLYEKSQVALWASVSDRISTTIGALSPQRFLTTSFGKTSDAFVEETWREQSVERSQSCRTYRTLRCVFRLFIMLNAIKSLWPSFRAISFFFQLRCLRITLVAVATATRAANSICRPLALQSPCDRRNVLLRLMSMQRSRFENPWKYSRRAVSAYTFSNSPRSPEQR